MHSQALDGSGMERRKAGVTYDGDRVAGREENFVEVWAAPQRGACYHSRTVVAHQG